MVFTPSAFSALISAFAPVILSFNINCQLSIINYQLINNTNASFVGTRYALGVGTQSLRDYAIAL